MKCFRCKHPEEEHQNARPHCKHQFTYKFSGPKGMEDRVQDCNCPGFAESEEQHLMQRAILRTMLAPNPTSKVFGQSARTLILDRMVCSLDLEYTVADIARQLDMTEEVARVELDALVKDTVLINTLLGYRLNKDSTAGQLILDLCKFQMDEAMDSMSKIDFDVWFHEFYGEFIRQANEAAIRRITFCDPLYTVELLDVNEKRISAAEMADVEIAKKLASILNIDYEFPK